MRTLFDLYIAWFKMGAFTFGGGYAMLPMIQKEVIEHYKWATEDEVMEYFAIGQCLPGIIAINTATFVGYHIKGLIGGIFATFGVITPSFIIITLIASLISNFSSLEIVQKALSGINIAVCVLMFNTVANLWKKNLNNLGSFTVFICAIIMAFFIDISTVFIIIISGIIGIIFAKLGWLNYD